MKWTKPAYRVPNQPPPPTRPETVKYGQVMSNSNHQNHRNSAFLARFCGKMVIFLGRNLQQLVWGSGKNPVEILLLHGTKNGVLRHGRCEIMAIVRLFCRRGG